jgi:hypothetical protein
MMMRIPANVFHSTDFEALAALRGVKTHFVYNVISHNPTRPSSIVVVEVYGSTYVARQAFTAEVRSTLDLGRTC